MDNLQFRPTPLISTTQPHIPFYSTCNPSFISMFAWVSSLALAASYVAAIHVGKPPEIASLNRNNPIVIKYRIARISTLSIAILALLPWFLCLTIDKYPDYWTAFRQLGIIPGFTNSYSFSTDVYNIGKALCKILLLYCGPITNYLVTGQARHLWDDFVDEFTTLQGFRDNVFAPITEELAYRGAVVSILQPYCSDFSLRVYSPLLFGLAHIHHGMQLHYIDKRPFSNVLLIVFAQWAYTTVFGVYANYFYIRAQENLWCAIIVHMVCNLIGFPSFDMREEYPRWYMMYTAMLVVGAGTFTLDIF